MPRSRKSALFLAYLYIFFQMCTCTPSLKTTYQQSRRSGALTNHVNSLPLFNTTVTSANGARKNPPKLQTKVYIQPSIKSASNLTHRQIMGERRVLTCKSSTATFHHSHCRHTKGRTYSIREYMAWCRVPLQSDIPQPTFTLPSEARAMASSTGTEDPSLHGEYGTCHMDEICVDSLYSLDYRNGFVLIANCVKKQLFQDAGIWNDEWDNLKDREGEEFGGSDIEDEDREQEPNERPSNSSAAQKPDDGDGTKDQNQEPLEGEPKGTLLPNRTGMENLPLTVFSGRYASVVITQGEEGTTPLEVWKIGLKSLGDMNVSRGTGGALGYHDGSEFEGDASNDDIGSQTPEGLFEEQEKSCSNCMELKTSKPFAPDTEALEMQVKMMGAGSTALAGILWVALLTG